MAEKLNPNKNEKLIVDVEVRSEKKASQEKLSKSEVKEALDSHSKEKLRAKQEIKEVIESDKEKKPRAAQAEKKPQVATKGIKKQQYKSTMRRVEARLPAYQRAFSKVINNPAVDAVSNVASKTIARPSGLLGGATAGFIGLLVLYLNARRIGFEYPAGSAFIFFVSFGWLAGLLVEYLYGAIKRIIKMR